MVKKSLFTITLLCLGLAAYPQTKTKITLGKPYGVIDAESKYYFSKGKELLTIKVDRKTIHLQKLNTDNLTFVKVRLYDDFPKNFVIELITDLQGKYYVFYSYWDGENEQLFAREIDFEAGTFIGQGRKIISVKEKLTGTLGRSGFFSMSVSDKYDFYVSSNESTLAIQYRFKPEFKDDSKNYDMIGLHIFEPSLNEIWTKKVKMPYTEKKMNNLDYSVDSKGNAYIVTSVYNDDTTKERKKGSDEPNYHLEILKISSSGKIVSTPVELVGNFVKTIVLNESPKGYMTCAGFYNIGKNAANADGVILFKLSQDNKLYDFKTYEIPVDVLNQFASSRTVRKNDDKDVEDRAEFENLRLSKIIVNDDGSTLLIGEQHYVITRSHYNSSTHSTTTTSTYFYNDMLATKIDASGKLAWMRKLPKRQQSPPMTASGGMFGGGGGGSFIGGMSFYYFPGATEHYLLFLDNEKNIALPVTKVPAVHRDGAGGFLTAYTINDKTGDVKKISILDTRNVEGMEIYQFTPRRIKETSPTSFVFEAYKKKKEDLLIKVEFAK